MGTADRLRHEIDSGKAGSKVPFPDPAAAPLGTDEEAAGTPASAEEVAIARATELGGDSLRGPAVTDERTRGYSGEADPPGLASGDRAARVRTRWYAILALAAGAVMLTLAMWMMH